MENKGWKIYSIIITTLFIMSWFFFVSMVMIGLHATEKETKCATEVCLDSDSYGFDSYLSICTCYVDNEVVNIKVID